MNETAAKEIKTAAVLLAAGSSARFNDKTPKQFALLLGKPVFIHSLSALCACEDIGVIALCLKPDDSEGASYAKKTVGEYFGNEKRIVFCEGGVTRAESLYKSLKFLIGVPGVSQNTKIISHDAARPNLTAEMLDSCLAELKTHKAVSLGVAQNDTLCLVNDEGTLVRFVDREKARRLQTPQCFTLSDYLKGYEAFNEAELKSVTDACGVLIKAGVGVKIIPGNEENIKITRFEDLSRVESVLIP